MSAIRFHFREGEVLQVRGMERASMDLHARNAAISGGRLASGMGQTWDDRDAQRNFGRFLGIDSEKDPRVNGLAESLALQLGSSFMGRGLFSWRGKEIGAWSLALNTSLAVGSDPVRLCAKIHATCEIHGYFEGKDRDWFAGLIEEGLEDGVFRKDFESVQGKRASMGWTELIEQLRKSDTEPVVMSFTVTDGFPEPPGSWSPESSPTEGSDEEDYRYAAWYDLPETEQFDLALAEIRKDEHRKPIGPETLRAYRFGHGLSLLDLMRGDIEKIEKNLGVSDE